MNRDELSERVHDYIWFRTIDLVQGLIRPG